MSEAKPFECLEAGCRMLFSWGDLQVHQEKTGHKAHRTTEEGQQLIDQMRGKADEEATLKEH